MITNRRDLLKSVGALLAAQAMTTPNIKGQEIQEQSTKPTGQELREQGTSEQEGLYSWTRMPRISIAEGLVLSNHLCKRC